MYKKKNGDIKVWNEHFNSSLAYFHASLYPLLLSSIKTYFLSLHFRCWWTWRYPSFRWRKCSWMNSFKGSMRRLREWQRRDVVVFIVWRPRRAAINREARCYSSDKKKNPFTVTRMWNFPASFERYVISPLFYLARLESGDVTGGAISTSVL